MLPIRRSNAAENQDAMAERRMKRALPEKLRPQDEESGRTKRGRCAARNEALIIVVQPPQAVYSVNRGGNIWLKVNKKATERPC